jgi:hypothetical protein
MSYGINDSVPVSLPGRDFIIFSHPDHVFGQDHYAADQSGGKDETDKPIIYLT